MNRRKFLKAGLAGITSTIFPWQKLSFLISDALAQNSGVGFDPDVFVGEKLEYHITFWWFDKVGSVSMSFQKLPDDRGYIAQAGGETFGVIAFLTQYRKDLYRSFMRYDEKSGLLLPYRFEEKVTIGQEITGYARTFDRDNGKITLHKAHRTGVVTEEIFDMPSPYTVDYLAAYYNLRAGAYGPPEYDKKIDIPTMPNQGTDKITVAFQDRDKTLAMQKADKLSWPWFSHIQLDPKMIRTERGRIDGWLSNDLVPEVGFIRKVILIGDVRGWHANTSKIPEVADIKPTKPVFIAPSHNGSPKGR